MAEPQARSYSQILGDMVAGFLARKRIPKLKPASPVLTVLEAAAQSDVRATQDLFVSVNARSLDRNEGVALDRIGNSEDLPRRTELAANGSVTFFDSSFTKKSTRISPAKAAPIVGSTTIYLVDATGWASTGSIYIGRDTDSYEGPIAYSALVDSGSYWTMTLSAPTQRFHQLQEGVVLAQGGDRTIPAGQQVSTPQGQSTTPVSFSTLFSAIIPDGETSVEGVFVVCVVPGSVGNVPQEAVSVVTSSPFPGCSVVNPTGFVTGRDTESDNDYRDRIKAERANKSKATDYTLQVKATGLTSDEDARRVVSASIVRAENEPVTLYIDDGTGYEEQSEAVALEPLVDSALGGEKSFQLAFRPVSKAYVQTLRSAPYELTEDSHLAVIIGGVTYDHYFDPTLFRNIESASAYEVVASINANPNVPMNARTGDGGNDVVIFASADTNEDIQVTSPVSGDDANDVFGFGINRVDTLKLYKNDRLLNKDGASAEVSTNSISSWSTLTGTETLTIGVDSTPAVTYSFTAQDFIDAATGFTAMGINTAAAWAAVFNARIPGITAVAGEDTVVLSSNSDRSARSRIRITGGTLTSKNVLALTDVSGKDADYTLNRNTGELRLKTGLTAGDSLTAGSFNTRAFLESSIIAPVTLAGTGNLWFVADGDAAKVTVGINTTDTYDLTKVASGAWGERWHLIADVGTPFTNVAADQWMIVWDTGFPALLRGIWRVASASSTIVRFDTPVTGQGNVSNFTFASGNIRFISTLEQPQNVQIPAAANYTANAFAAAINTSLTGAIATVYRTTKLRTKTRSFALGGDIALVAVDTEGAKVGLAETTSAVENLDGHLASVEAGNSEIGTPSFFMNAATAQSAGLTDLAIPTYTANTVAWNKFIVGEHNTDDFGLGTTRWGNNAAFRSMIASLTVGGSVAVTTRKSSLQKWAEGDSSYISYPYGLGPSDDLTIVIDQDTTTKRFLTKMYRQLQGSGATYGTTNTFVDDDNGGLSLTQAFGLGYSFDDFAVHMHARVLTHSADATKRILWRWKRLGPDGNQARIRYVYPSAPSQAVGVSLDNMPTATGAFATANSFNLISVNLPSDVQKTGYNVRSTTKIGYGSNVSGGMDALTLAVGFAISSAQRAANVTTLTLTLPSGLYGVTDHNLQIADQVYVDSTDVNYTSGLKTITARTATTISYAEVAANFGPTANIGTVSNDVAPAGFSGATPSPIAVGDIVRLDDSTTLPADIRNRNFRITHIGAQFLQGYADYNYAGTQNNTLLWAAVGDATKLKFYSLLAASATATAIAAAVNALPLSPVTATVTGTGAGQILLASREEALSEDPLVEYAALTDGVNWVASTISPGSMAGQYQLTFKAPITAGLVSNSDWANEEVRIVPITAANVVQWLNTPAVAGLFAVASVEASANGHKPQIASLTPGTVGSVQVQGGLANSATAAVVGAGIVDASVSPVYSAVSILAADSEGFRAGSFVRLENSQKLTKSGLIDSTTAVTSIAVDGTVTLSAGPLVANQLGSDTLATLNIRRQGRYMFYQFLNTGASEGDWFVVTGSGDPNDIAEPNRGTFRIVRCSSDGVWVENENGVEEVDKVCDWQVYSAGSMMPGDTLSISSSAWGAANQGIWTVESVQSSGTVFKLDTTAQAMASSGAIAALGATEAAKFIVTEKTPLFAVKQIHAIAPNAASADLMDIKFDTSQSGSSFNESVGTVMSALDKLAFPTAIVPGLDGYRYGTGLIGEVNRVIYGDPRDRATYPGVAGAGVKVNISGPLVKRLSISLAIRIRLGVIPSDVINRVRAAVASVINDAGIGKPIAISSLVTAAGGVNGVVAVSVISPTYSSGSDLIAIQPYEKAIILDAEQDISISIVGE